MSLFPAYYVVPGVVLLCIIIIFAAIYCIEIWNGLLNIRYGIYRILKVQLCVILVKGCYVNDDILKQTW